MDLGFLDTADLEHALTIFLSPSCSLKHFSMFRGKSDMKVFLWNKRISWYAILTPVFLAKSSIKAAVSTMAASTDDDRQGVISAGFRGTIASEERNEFL